MNTYAIVFIITAILCMGVYFIYTKTHKTTVQLPPVQPLPVQPLPVQPPPIDCSIIPVTDPQYYAPEYPAHLGSEIASGIK